MCKLPQKQICSPLIMHTLGARCRVMQDCTGCSPKGTCSPQDPEAHLSNSRLWMDVQLQIFIAGVIKPRYFLHMEADERVSKHWGCDCSFQSMHPRKTDFGNLNAACRFLASCARDPPCFKGKRFLLKWQILALFQ